MKDRINEFKHKLLDKSVIFMDYIENKLSFVDKIFSEERFKNA